MKETSPNLPYTDRFRFWHRAHGGKSPDGGTDGTRSVNSHHPHSSDPSEPRLNNSAGSHRHHALDNSGTAQGGPFGNNSTFTTVAASTSSNDGQASKPSTQGASQGAVLSPAENEKQNTSDDNNDGESKPKPHWLVEFARVVKMILLHSKLNLLLVFVPIGIIVSQLHLSPGLVFAMNAVAIIPLAGLLSHATESVARKLGDTIGALLNVTFGNAVELIIL